MSVSESGAIRAIAQTQILTCTSTISLSQASQMMSNSRSSSIIVVDANTPVGILTESDALKIDFSCPETLHKPVSEFMSSPVHSISDSASMDDATHEFKRLGIRHLVVVDTEGECFGVLSQSDVVRHQKVDHFLDLKEVALILPAQPPLLLEGTEGLDVAVRQMRNRHSSHVVVVEKGRPVGLLTERDLIRVVARGGPLPTLTEVMSKPLVCIPRSMSLLTARTLMLQRQFRHLGVTDDMEELVGVISFNDILSNIEETYINRLKNALASRVADLQRTETDLDLAQALISASMDGIMVTNDKGIIKFVNPAFSQLTGYSEKEALGQKSNMLKSGRQDADFYQRMWAELNKNGSWRGEIWNRRKSGEIYPEWLTITQIHNSKSGEIYYAGIFSDITERKKSELIIENLAYFDPLTKLPNRQLLLDRLDVALAAAHRDAHHVAVVFIDLDHFKRVNDTLGHPAGDQLLCEIASRLKDSVRVGDTIARLGGDELIMLLTELDHPETAYRIVQRALDALKAPIKIDNYELHVTASMGCSLYPSDGADTETLLKHADTAMYRAKQAGRNNFQLFSPEMNALSVKRLKIENALRHALAKQQLKVHYQPKYSLPHKRIVGVEALLRWHCEELGVVPPFEFIPLAEELGLIGDIGAWVLQEACRQCKAWHDQGYKLQVAVNVSPRQFQHVDIAENVEQALAQSGLPATALDIEITESCLIHETDSVFDTLNRMRAWGVSTSMDDFGTGYSSLSLLNRIPLDHLKIDRSFIQGTPDDKSSMVLVSTIILMAHNLGLKVIAEGVETRQQLYYLAQLDCDQVQGYYFSPPVSAEAMQDLLLQSGFE